MSSVRNKKEKNTAISHVFTIDFFQLTWKISRTNIDRTTASRLMSLLFTGGPIRGCGQVSGSFLLEHSFLVQFVL
jgi:hypothetical protein